MIKNLCLVFFIFMATVSITYTRAIAADNQPNVINPFSDDYKNNASAQVFSNSTTAATSSKKIKVISTFEENQTQSNLSETQANATVSPQDNAQGAPQQTGLGSQTTVTEKGPEQDYKVLKSN